MYYSFFIYLNLVIYFRSIFFKVESGRGEIIKMSPLSIKDIGLGFPPPQNISGWERGI